MNASAFTSLAIATTNPAVIEGILLSGPSFDYPLLGVHAADLTDDADLFELGADLFEDGQPSFDEFGDLAHGRHRKYGRLSGRPGGDVGNRKRSAKRRKEGGRDDRLLRLEERVTRQLIDDGIEEFHNGLGYWSLRDELARNDKKAKSDAREQVKEPWRTSDGDTTDGDRQRKRRHRRSRRNYAAPNRDDVVVNGRTGHVSTVVRTAATDTPRITSQKVLRAESVARPRLSNAQLRAKLGLAPQDAQ